MATNFAQRTMAAIAAIGMTSFMLFAYFHVPASIVAQGLVA